MVYIRKFSLRYKRNFATLASQSEGNFCPTLVEKHTLKLFLFINPNVEKVWGARYTLGARYLSKNMVHREAGRAKDLPAPWYAVL